MRENRKRVLSLLLALVLLAGLLPVSAYAEADVPVIFVATDGSGNTVIPLVMVYNAKGELVSQAKGYDHYLAPGSYTFSAEADGYQSVRQSFTVNTVAEGSAQAVSFTMSAAAAGEDSGEKEQAEEKQEEQKLSEPEATTQPVTGGIFSARYSRHQVFGVYRSPAYPTGTQESPNPFTVMDLSAPDFAGADYYYFASLGPASQAGVPVSGGWNAGAEALDPWAVSLHAVTGDSDVIVASGVIGALGAEGFLFDADGLAAWFSNTKGYHYSSTAITYVPVSGGRLVCDVNLLAGSAAESMLEPAEGTSGHIHEWTVEAEGAVAVYRCVADGCPNGNAEYTMTLSVPAAVPAGGSVKATVLRASGDAEWPAELEQDVVYYAGRGDTEYAKSTTPPTAEGAYTATVSVGYRYLTRTLTVDFVVGNTGSGDYPEQNFEETSLNGVLVQVHAEQEAFPYGTKMIVSDVPSETAIAAAEGIIAGNVLDAVAVDITFYTSSGQVVEPAGKDLVVVKLVTNRPVEGTAHEVIHIKDNDVLLIGEAIASADEADFTAPDFSIYAIVGTDYTKEYDTYEFYDIDDQLIRSQKVKAGDTLYEPETPVFTGKTFLGWYVDKGTEQVAFSGGQHAVPADYTASGKTVKLYPVFGETYFATFYNSANDSAGVRARYSIGAGQSIDFSSVTVEPADDTQRFIGWVDEDNNTVTSPLTLTENSDGTVTWSDGGTWTKEVKDLSLYPKFETGHWVYFDKNLTASAVSYTAPVFVVSGGKAVRPSDPVAQSEAFTFRNWYTEKECITIYDFDSIVTEDKTLFAGWDTGNARYYVTIWKQKSTDRYDATEKTYDYIESHAHYGPIGGLANANEAETAKTQYWGFYLGEYDKDVEIKSDGSTVVNVYYDRQLIIEKVHSPIETYKISGTDYYSG